MSNIINHIRNLPVLYYAYMSQYIILSWLQMLRLYVVQVKSLKINIQVTDEL